MTNSNDEEQEFYNTAERHHQIMEEGYRLANRIFLATAGLLITACGFLFFFFRR